MARWAEGQRDGLGSEWTEAGVGVKTMDGRRDQSGIDQREDGGRMEGWRG